jgi:regulator of protease activity HflC (stomatin/prohibitin superfamily)
MLIPILIALLIIILFVSIRIISQGNVVVIERLGRYSRIGNPGLIFLIPIVDRVRIKLDMRERVVSFAPQPVITRDNVTVSVDTVVYFQVINPKNAVYEIQNYIIGIEQITVTTLRNIIGGISLEDTLTSRDIINEKLRIALDETTGKWGVRANRIEVKSINPPESIQQAMEKQMRAERDKRASILIAEGVKQSKILESEGLKQSTILEAEGKADAAFKIAKGESLSVDILFKSLHNNKIDKNILAYRFLSSIPEIAKNDANKMWFIDTDINKIVSMFQGLKGKE